MSMLTPERALRLINGTAHEFAEKMVTDARRRTPPQSQRALNEQFLEAAQHLPQTFRQEVRSAINQIEEDTWEVDFRYCGDMITHVIVHLKPPLVTP